MPPIRPAAIGLIWLVLTLLPTATSATTVMPVSLSHMTAKADTIVAGVVTETYSYWESGRIYTNATVATLEFFKHPTADRPRHITVKYLGGQVDETRMDVQGAPHLSADDEMVFFLMKHQDTYTIFGLHYGLCPILTDGATHAQRVSGPVFRTPATQTCPPLPPEGERVELFFQRLRELVRPPGAP